ncbi:hypothetical protein, partial [Streptomyces sp. SPB78]|uniref:hypothetical protein n=1 Tax=Streptomyces sp. (strain SPB78) TaxID=591157 RepID=UPI001F22F625
MRDEYECRSGPGGERALGAQFGVRVQVARGLVEHEERGGREPGAGERDELALRGREPVRPDRRVPAPHGRQDRFETDGPCRCHECRLVGVRAQVGDGLAECARGKVRLLRGEGAEEPGIGVAGRAPVPEDLT